MTVLMSDDWELAAGGQYEASQQEGPGLFARVYPVLNASDADQTGEPDEWCYDIRHDDALIWEGFSTTRDAVIQAAERAVAALTWAYAEQYVRCLAERDAEAVRPTP